jgi:CelD/BcsL family acetyltransferase involved in cellulose biosynthesis
MQEWIANESLRTYRPAPFVDFSEFADYSEYRAFLMKRSKDRFKKNWRLRERLENDFGTLKFTFNDSGDDVLEKSLTWKSAQLRETGLPDLFRKEENWEFYRELKRRGVLLSSTLRANERLLSSWLGYTHNGYWSGWIFTYDHDPALKKYSIGWQLMDSLLQTCHERKLKGFDFSIGHSDYKMTYGTHVRLLGSVGTRPAHQVVLNKLEKLAKSQLERFPSVMARARVVARRFRG